MSEFEKLDAMNLIKNQDTDARKWAESFNWHLSTRGEQPIDPELMIGWFANAMCVQMDVTSMKRAKEILRLKELIRESVSYIEDDSHYHHGLRLKQREEYLNKVKDI